MRLDTEVNSNEVNGRGMFSSKKLVNPSGRPCMIQLSHRGETGEVRFIGIRHFGLLDDIA